MNSAVIASAAAIVVAGMIAGCEPANRPATRPSEKVTMPATRAAEEKKPAPAVVVPTSQPAVAMINGRPITRADLEQPLIDAYGLNVLMNLALRETARQEAEQAKVTATQADFDAEREITMKGMFKDAEVKDYDRLLDQFLAQQRISRPEFDLVIETNAYLRKIAEPMLKGKITDESLQQAFRALYGENVEVRDIQLANLQEVAVVRQRLDSGESFEKVAREMSRDPRTKASGGLLPPFSREITNLSQAFKDAAFSLKEPGEISDPIQTGDSFHLIQLVQKIAPKAVKYEDVKDSVRKELYDRLMYATITELRKELARATIQAMDIRDPSLKKQFVERQEKQQAQERDRASARLEGEQERKELSARQTIPVPATTNAVTPATGTEARERPPATKSGP
ncbi:MAG TPA: peptidylprolyl isomerase [Tepidisphaeraceae bacterium]|jgi:parvulin-like peptidyl-prolyl isomerase|nr:peptidylprolyl isomerase [Tepidisphaeraceae bacterium]